MADFNSSLPVRTEAAGDVIAKIADATTPSQQLAVDSSGRIIAKIEASNGDALTDTGGSLDVNVTNAISTGVADETAFTYGTSNEQTVGGVFQDTAPTITAGKTGAVRITGQRGMHMNLRDSSGNEKLGQLTMANSIPVAIASDQSAVSTNLTEINGSAVVTSATGVQKVGVTGNTGAAMDAAGQNASSPANELLVAGQFNTTPTTITSGNVSPLQMDSAGNLLTNLKTALPAGSNLIGNVNVFQGGAATSPSNPIYVSTVDAGGTSVDSYQTSAALAAAATANLDYTVTAAKTFYSQQLWATASGKIKVVLQYETAPASGTFVTFWVGFNSTSDPNILIPLPPTKTQVAGAKIRVAITNEDKQSMDVYETLSGNEQ